METTVKKESSFHVSAKRKELFVDITCFALIILFIYTASSKLLTYKSFELGLSNSVLLKSYSQTIAWLIPGLEILFSAFLIIPKLKWYGLFSSFLLLIAFTTYLVYMVSYGGPKSCGCGGVIQSLTWNQHIFFNLFFILITGLSLKFIKNPRSKYL